MFFELFVKMILAGNSNWSLSEIFSSVITSNVVDHTNVLPSQLHIRKNWEDPHIDHGGNQAMASKHHMKVQTNQSDN